MRGSRQARKRASRSRGDESSNVAFGVHNMMRRLRRVDVDDPMIKPERVRMYMHASARRRAIQEDIERARGELDEASELRGDTGAAGSGG